MTDNTDKINELLAKLDALLIKQDVFSREIATMKEEIYRLKYNASSETSAEKEAANVEKPISMVGMEAKTEVEAPVATTQTPPPPQRGPLLRKMPRQMDTTPMGKSDLEKFIGENLINKIGILITVIGVAIGAKYSIDNNLISPLTRIILGYAFGLGLLGFGIKLKTQYENYSAVLVSGAMAIMYFITYFAYSFYGLIPQEMAFGLMVIFTAFTVFAALKYDKSIIAHIGLVGAYAVPFLLSDSSGKVHILFSYMAVINIGIMVLSFRKYWNSLFYVAFCLTWVVFGFWYISDYQTDQHFSLGLTFLTVFFAIFYVTFLAYKLRTNGQFSPQDVLLLMTNSFIFYGFGYFILDNHPTGKELLGLFTLANAVVHFVVSAVIYRQKLVDRQLFYLISGLVLVFITMAIPVQLDGNWVTLLWAGEAALLFWIGRTKNIAFYEKISYALMLLAFGSIGQDWQNTYQNHYFSGAERSEIPPIMNIHFLSSMLFVAAFGFINWVGQNKNYASPLDTGKGFPRLFAFLIPGICLFALYYTFFLEMENYWSNLYANSAVSTTDEGGVSRFDFNRDMLHFKSIFLVNYSLLFVSLLAYFNNRKLRNSLLGYLSLGLIVFAVFALLTEGLFALSELRETYLEQPPSPYFKRGSLNLMSRYISYAFVALALVTFYKTIRQDFIPIKLKMVFDLLLHTTILWIASSELIHWMDFSGSTQSYKLGLSILWGVYALLLIMLGIWKNKKHLRIGAIVLFAGTLFKLFSYDISDLNTISKTIVFVSLGVLLLIISFLYNKYKHLIVDETENN